MSGLSSRFSAAGYNIPKFMIEVDGKTVIQHIVDLYPQDSKFMFIINDDHAKDMELCNYLDGLDIDSLIICSVPVHKKGPVYSVNYYQHHIEDNEQVIVNYCDFSMKWDFNKFEQHVNETNCDGCVVCYTGFHPHMLGSDNYAFCKTNEDNNIIEIREKQPFTDNKMNEYASTGTYYFKKGSYVKKYFKQLIEEDDNINGEFYVSLVHNHLTRDGLVNNVYEISHMLQWGTPLDLDMYRKWSQYNRRVMKGQDNIIIANCVTVLPMAGRAERFRQEGYMVPKPCIQVNGYYMMEQALKCLPKTDQTILGARTDHKDLLPLDNYPDVVWLDEVLPGQACTTEKIINQISNPDKSILVTACDNAVLYDANKFISLVDDIDNDIIVWTYRNNYTTYYKPEKYSWVELDGDNVTKVNVKEFKGGNPLDKHAIVGTMFFRNKNIYLKSLEGLYKRNSTTNGEFYIDNLLNDAIDLGYKIKNFEVEHYICWGTPDDLQTYQYWQRFFDQVEWHPYDYRTEYFTN
tara:strand:- start:1267 stop:2820 length:1554 start_codon:yes stop_codon:yes gene_type:complete